MKHHSHTATQTSSLTSTGLKHTVHPGAGCPVVTNVCVGLVEGDQQWPILVLTCLALAPFHWGTFADPEGRY